LCGSYKHRKKENDSIANRKSTKDGKELETNGFFSNRLADALAD